MHTYTPLQMAIRIQQIPVEEPTVEDFFLDYLYYKHDVNSFGKL